MNEYFDMHLIDIKDLMWSRLDFIPFFFFFLIIKLLLAKYFLGFKFFFGQILEFLELAFFVID